MGGQSTKDASQTLLRGLDVIEAVSAGPLTLDELAARVGLSRSTTHRLAAALAGRGYLALQARAGYRLGPTLLALGHAAGEQVDLVMAARPVIAVLSQSSGDTVHLGILDGDQALYLDKVPGSRRVAISSRVGDRQPLTTTGLGKALMLERGAAYWRARMHAEGTPAAEAFVACMTRYAADGLAFDLEENEDRIRCVAAPIRDAGGAIVAAISVSSAAQYMDDRRMASLGDAVRGAADEISLALGAPPARAAPGVGDQAT